MAEGKVYFSGIFWISSNFFQEIRTYGFWAYVDNN